MRAYEDLWESWGVENSVTAVLPHSQIDLVGLGVAGHPATQQTGLREGQKTGG